MRILYSIVERRKPMKFLLALHVCKVTRLDMPGSSMCMYTQTDTDRQTSPGHISDGRESKPRSVLPKSCSGTWWNCVTILQCVRGMTSLTSVLGHPGLEKMLRSTTLQEVPLLLSQRTCLQNKDILFQCITFTIYLLLVLPQQPAAQSQMKPLLCQELHKQEQAKSSSSH